MSLSRRAILPLPLLALLPAATNSRFAPLSDAIAGIEASTGGQVGLAVRVIGAPISFAHRADTRFAMCSTFKAPLAAQLLDSGLPLSQRLPVKASDMVDHAPVTTALIGKTASLSDLCAAMLITSDNVAANLLLHRLGGPEAHTAWLRKMGDTTTRLDRNEPELNTAIPGDPRDTTTPAAMADLMTRLLTGLALKPAARRQLLAWMRASITGNAMIRPALPKGWQEANRTGAGGHGTRNIISLITPPSGRPILITLYMAGVGEELAARDAHAPPIARALLQSLA